MDARRGLDPTPGAGHEVSLDSVFRKNADRWREAFIDWLGALNRRNAGLFWWAHTTTAKNFLSSPLGDACFTALALVELARSCGAKELYVINADELQAAVVRQALGRPTATRWRLAVLAIGGLVRLSWQFARVFVSWATGQLRLDLPISQPDVVLITYIDRNFKGGPDPFFGPLASLLAAGVPPRNAVHFAFLHAPYRELRRRMAASRPRYRALFSALSGWDIVWAFAASLRAWRSVFRVEAPALEGLAVGPLLRQALYWDLGRGGYFLNLLVYRATRNLTKRWRPRWMIYPYENKSLEKMIVLGARASGSNPFLVGFQHTAITRRHTTLLFAEGEALCTPLPDRIVTAGDVARDYLASHGRYPAGLLVSGCSLRQAWRAPLPRRSSAARLRLLLALSSSRRELIESLRYLRDQLTDKWELGVRPHPEFPLSALPAELWDWVALRATDFSRTPLETNLEWCDVALYVSSTVGLEALMIGRPAVNLRLSDPIDPDPLLEPVALAWKAESPERLATVLEEIHRMAADEFRVRQEDTVRAMTRYFCPVTSAGVSVFLP